MGKRWLYRYTEAMAERSNYGKTQLAQACRQRIKATAKQLILEKGIAGTQMKEIAANCGIGKKTLYRYYPNIEAIAEDILIDTVNSPDFFNLFESVRGLNGLESLRKTAFAYSEYCLTHDEAIKYFFEYDYHFRTPANPSVQNFWKNRPHVFHEALHAGIADGSIAIDPERVHELALVIDHSIFATITRLIMREKVYLEECNYTRTEVRALSHLLVNGVLYESLQG